MSGLFIRKKMSNNNLNSLYKSFTIARTRTSNAFAGASSTNINHSVKKHKTLMMIAGFIVLLIAVFFVGRMFAPKSADRITAPAPEATQMLNKTYKFPLKDDKGKTVSNITYILQSADLQDSFIYQGKVATAVKGRTFLIFDLKITNPYTKTIEINAKDYVRVKMNGSNELLAPEIHNDPVQIQANSTKYTRIGLPVNDTDKNIILLVGELQGKKDSINLSLKR